MNKEELARLIKSYSNIHLPGDEPDVFIFSTPRSGSTWLMELIASQPKFKYCNEPLNLRNWRIREASGIESWDVLYNSERREKLRRYFEDIRSGRVRFLNPNPFRRYHHPLTSRIVYKIINGAEADINWMEETFGGRVVYMLRHPIPVIFSRRVLPRLETFLNSDFADWFTQEQLNYARQTVAGNDHFRKGAISWCMQNAVPLMQAQPSWTIVTYEQLVVDPQPVVAALSKNLALPKPERILAQINVPSKVTAQSDKETKQHFQILDESNKLWLVEKWKKRASPEQIQFVQESLDLFGISAYQAKATLPVMYWHIVP